MSKVYKRDLPLVIGTIAAIVMIVEFFVVPTPELTAVRGDILSWVTIAAAFGVFVGALATFLYHLSRARLGEVPTEQRLGSVIAMLTALFFIVVGISFPGLTASDQYVLIYNHIFRAFIDSVRTIAFFACMYGAYRAFRAMSLEAAVFVIAGFIYLLRTEAIGQIALPQVIPIGDWLLTVPNRSATRAAYITSAIGALIIAIRVFAGREKSIEEVAVELGG